MFSFCTLAVQFFCSNAQIMSSMKTFAVSLLILNLVLAMPARAHTSLAQTFAGCVGRMSAEMEHAWLMQRDAHLHSEQRLTFLSLLDATAPPGRARALLAHRVETKLAHAALLTLSDFSDDAEQAKGARIRASWHRAACQALLLDS